MSPEAPSRVEGVTEDIGLAPEEIDRLVDETVVPEAACALNVARSEFPEFFPETPAALEAHAESCGDCQKREAGQQGLN